MNWDAFLAAVQERGEYSTMEEAERSSRVVLALLGAHLVGEVRNELAARLLETLALVLLNPLQAHEPLVPERFVRATAAWIEGATEQTAAWDVSAVLSVVADIAGDDLLNRILLQLPRGLRPSLRSPPASLTSRGAARHSARPCWCERSTRGPACAMPGQA